MGLYKIEIFSKRSIGIKIADNNKLHIIDRGYKLPFSKGLFLWA